MSGKQLIGHGIVILYMLVPYFLLTSDTIEPVILGMPYALWSFVLYGILATPLLFFVFKLAWPNIPDEVEE